MQILGIVFGPLLAGFVIGMSLLFIITEAVHIQIYGWPIKEEDLDKYLRKYLAGSQLNPLETRNHLLSVNIPQFIALSPSFLCRWYIENYGVVPRWSKWSKKIDQHRAFCASLSPQVPLSEL